MRVAKLILVVEPGTGRTSKLVPIQQLEIGRGKGKGGEDRFD